MAWASDLADEIPFGQPLSNGFDVGLADNFLPSHLDGTPPNTSIPGAEILPYDTLTVDDVFSFPVLQSSLASISPGDAAVTVAQGVEEPNLWTLDWSDFSLPSEPASSSSSLRLCQVEGSEQSPATAKRARGTLSNDDPKLASWKSPLCPNRREDGRKPSDCNSECAPFLFANVPERTDNCTSGTNSDSQAATDTSRSETLRRKRRTPEDTTLPSISTRTAEGQRCEPSISSPKHFSDDGVYRSPRQPKVGEKRRVPHREVEKKYRENVSAQLEALRRILPTNRPCAGLSDVDIEDLPGARYSSKAAMLSSATAYIVSLQNDKSRLLAELETLKRRNEELLKFTIAISGRN